MHTQIVAPGAGVLDATVAGVHAQAVLAAAIRERGSGCRSAGGRVRRDHAVNVGRLAAVVEEALDQVGAQASAELPSELLYEAGEAGHARWAIGHPAPGQDVEGGNGNRRAD